MMLKSLNLLVVNLILVSLTSCKSLPERPNLVSCSIQIEQDGKTFYGDCHAEDGTYWYKQPMIEMLGDQCLGSVGIAAVKRYFVELDEYVSKKCN